LGLYYENKGQIDETFNQKFINSNDDEKIKDFKKASIIISRIPNDSIYKALVILVVPLVRHYLDRLTDTQSILYKSKDQKTPNYICSSLIKQKGGIIMLSINWVICLE
jgi:hypothetical protein